MNLHVQPIRVLVVDDSAFMRNRLSMMLMKCQDMQVVGTAKDGHDAIGQVQRTQPDVVTLDIEMPGMNGLEVLDHLMEHFPLPIIMVSAFTEEGAAVTLQALERGAVDFIPKPMNNSPLEIKGMEALLPMKVRAAHGMRHRIARVRSMGIQKEMSEKAAISCLDSRGSRSALAKVERGHQGAGERKQTMQKEFPLVVIGASTGGPNLLKALIRELPKNFPGALLIIQHMPKFFTKVFAENLHAVAAIPICEAQDGDILRPGRGFVAPGDHHLVVARQDDGQAMLRIVTEPLGYPYRPSVDAAMASAAEQFGRSTVGLVLTGMGNDGMVGSQKIKAHGGIVLAQNEATSMIYGMPRAVVELGLADAVLSDVELSTALIQAVDSVCFATR